MDVDQYTIGCLGVGNMGYAIVSHLSKEIPSDRIFCFDIDKSRLEIIKDEKAGLVVKEVKELCDKSDFIIIAVKPNVVRQLISEIKTCVADKVIVSVAAGIKINTISKLLKSTQKIVRIMPNTPALTGEGMIVISPDNNVDEKSLNIIKNILGILGKVLIMPEELMDAVTAISACGPAYFFTMLQAMADGGVKLGIPRDKALLLSAQTMYGSAKMVLETNEEPITLRGKVTSPGGSTIEAVHQLEKAGFSGIIMDAIEIAALKTKKLGEEKK